ncbi:MAG: hypothetical protein DRQ40_10665 [Gammaproteobacteria bacterium]|nr:MAG: hypothetical protein DRQ40_10665 [Gammaproteobacteria bacterium]
MKLMLKPHYKNKPFIIPILRHLQMNETTLTILGFPVIIRYVIYDGGYTEWHIKPEGESLVSTMLRIHYTQYIEAEIRKAWFEEEYERNIINSAQMSIFEEDNPF